MSSFTKPATMAAAVLAVLLQALSGCTFAAEAGLAAALSALEDPRIVPPEGFQAVYQATTGGSITITASTVTIADRDLVLRNATKLRIDASGEDLLGSGEGSFPDPYTQYIYLDASGHIVRADAACSGWMDCRYYRADWDPQGNPPVFGIGLLRLLHGGVVSYTLDQTHQSTPLDIQLGPGIAVRFPQEANLPQGYLNYLRLADDSYEYAKFGWLPSKIHLGAELSSENLRLDLVSVQERESSNPTPDAWPLALAPPGQGAPRLYYPGADADLDARGHTVKQAIEFLIANDADAQAMAETGCLTDVSFHGEGYFKPSVSTHPALDERVESRSTPYRIEMEAVGGSAIIWSVVHGRELGVGEFRIESKEEASSYWGCSPSNWAASPKANAKAFYDTVDQWPLHRAPNNTGFGHIRHFESAAQPLIRPKETYVWTYIPDFVDVSTGFATTPYAITIDATTGWMKAMISNPSDIEALDRGAFDGGWAMRDSGG